MRNPITRMKEILGELQRNGRRAIKLAEAQAQQMGPMSDRIAALEASTRQLLGSASHLQETARAMEASIIAPGDPAATLMQAYHRLGILNYEDAMASGEQPFLEAFLRRWPDTLVLDVGANQGDYSALVRALSPRPTIHAFEPHPRSFAVLEARSRELHVVPHQLAMGEAEGEVSLFDYADNQGSQHASLYRDVIEAIHHRPATPITTPCSTLDAVVTNLGRGGGGGPIGLLKIDTEGHELAVLKGARRLLAGGAIRTIQFEFNEMHVVARVFLRDFIELLPDYRLFRLLPNGALPLEPYDPRTMEIFAFQNIVCVRRDLDSDWVMRGAAA